MRPCRRRLPAKPGQPNLRKGLPLRSSLERPRFLALLVLALRAILAFRHLGRWLVREDPLAHADAIVVLERKMPARAEEAAKIFGRDMRPRFGSAGLGPAGELDKLGVSYTGEEEYDRPNFGPRGRSSRLRCGSFRMRLWTRRRKSKKLCASCGTQAKNPSSSSLLRSTPGASRFCGGDCGDGPNGIVRAAWEDNFDADHWWRNTRDLFSVVREVMGLANAWAGLPVRPHTQD